MQWFGPKGFKMPGAKIDFRPGGTFHYCMEAPNGEEMWGKFVYREIVAPERIVFVSSFSDEDGEVTRHPLSPDWPLESAVDGHVRREGRADNCHGAVGSVERDRCGAQGF
jgi:uncharacterized protein YndB with AHSA1/START domain